MSESMRAIGRLLRPLDRNGNPLRAGIYRKRGPWNPPPLAHLWILPAGAKLAVLAILIGATMLGTSPAYLSYVDRLPDVRLMAAQAGAEDTLIYASDGTTLLADLHPAGYQHYSEPLPAMGRYLPMAAVAIEDHNFFSEPGVDPGAMLRAAWVDWHAGGPVEGASTITQQLIKLKLVGSRPTLSRKLSEVLLAMEAERAYPKQEILEMYLNTVFFGNDAYGSAAAARTYFHTETARLDLAQAAMLAGFLRDPTYSNPFADWKAARARQRQVLDAMVRARMVAPAEAAAAWVEDISPPKHMFGPENRILAPGFVSYVTGQLVSRYGVSTTFGGGLRVVTTLDWRLQQLAQKAIADEVTARSRWHVSQGALVAIDPRTGALEAMVGSADPDANGGRYNMAVWPPRNPGSSMKIFTYTAALASRKFTMVTRIADSPIYIRPPGATETYAPRDYDGRWHGICRLEQCLGNSLNVPAVKVELGIGVAAVVQEARVMGAPPWTGRLDEQGAMTYTANDPLSSYGPSLTLGGYGETPLQMATGASVLAAQGILHPPFAVWSISTAQGSRVFHADPAAAAVQVVDPRVAFIMGQILSDGDNRAMIFGPSTPLSLPGRRVAAKTGTAEDFADAWTIGYTPSMVAAVWMGNPDWRQKMAFGLDGVFTAAPAWHNFMQAALDTLGVGDQWFAEPPGLTHAGVGGKQAYFLPGTSPDTSGPGLPIGATSSPD
ncbi:hypothetical protein EPN29_01230 [bacterium]|nr:MAG: hypothetical protein EPN29_01230 [bacterium]